MSKKIDLTGKRFGRLIVIKESEKTYGQVMWLCKCDCGKTKSINGNSLRRGISTSCGCYRLEQSNVACHKHGLSNTRLHKIWRDMISRCYSVGDYHGEWYREKGIIICDEWKENFQAFYDWSVANGYSDKLTIDRIDNDKGYSPDNCRWITILEQCHNRGIFKNNKSGCSGVHFEKDTKLWRATITINYKVIRLGRYKKLDDAIAARKAGEIKYWNKDAE